MKNLWHHSPSGMFGMHAKIYRANVRKKKREWCQSLQLINLLESRQTSFFSSRRHVGHLEAMEQRSTSRRIQRIYLADRGSDSNNRYKAKQIRKRRRTTKYTNLQKRIAKLEGIK
jgi:hypothetical protein